MMAAAVVFRPVRFKWDALFRRYSFYLLVVVFSLGWQSVARANQIWEFVDKDGVTHIGNVPPSSSARGVIWLNRVPPVVGTIG